MTARVPKIPRISIALAGALCLSVVGATTVTLNQPAPDFAARSLQGPNLRLSEMRSDVVVLNFWASWCGKCRDALPLLGSLHETFQQQGLQVLAVGVDGDQARSAAFESADFPVLFDDPQHSVSRLYDVGNLPLTLVIDRTGKVRYMHTGLQRDTGQQIAAQVAQLLAE